MKKIKIKPSKVSSVLGLVFSIFFVYVGFDFMMNIYGYLGKLWTNIAILLTCINLLNIVLPEGITTKEIIVDDSNKIFEKSTEQRLQELQDLYIKELILKEEYEKRRKEIIKDI